MSVINSICHGIEKMGLGKERANKTSILTRLFSYNIAGCVLYVFLYTLFDETTPATWYISAATLVYFLGYRILDKVPALFSAYFFILTYFTVQTYFNFFVLPLETFNYMLSLLAPSGLLLFFDILTKRARVLITVVCFFSVIVLVINGPYKTQISFDPFEMKIIQASVISIFFASSLVLFDLYQKEIKNLEVRLVDLANIDVLSGVYNRRALFTLGQHTLEVTSEKRHKSAVLVIDIDHFKKVNDAHGHAIGDIVIQQVGNYLNKVIGEPGIVGRYGGEEFVILMPEYNLEKAYLLAEEIRMTIATLSPMPEADDIKGEIPHITVSIGVTSQVLRYESLDSLIAKADEALYHAKQTGRNKTVRYIAENFVSRTLEGKA